MAKRPGPHPRLWIGEREIERLRETPKRPKLKEAQKALEGQAKRYLASPEVTWTPHTHNGHLLRARATQGRVVTLLVRWLQTGDETFRSAALDHIRRMAEWEYWSWIVWREGNADPDAIFDLSYGENSATLAMAYDILHDTLSDEEKALFLDQARDRALKSFLRHTGKQKMWWFGKPDSNWNTVCAGGGGMLALAMYEDLPEARKALPRAEKSFVPYMEHLKETGGAWPEGIGYWNYGFFYAFMYLLSRQKAYGKRHDLMKHDSVKKTLSFPVAFCPNGVPCSFGDVNHWSPQPFHFAAAEDLNEPEVLGALDSALERMRFSPKQEGRPLAAMLLAFHPRSSGKKPKAKKNVADLYSGQDWAVLADRMPDPRLCLTIRGGTTEVPHGHMDLMSYHCVVEDESMLAGISNRGYLDSTFSPRRWEIFEMTPHAKNTILINGVGITRPSTVRTVTCTVGRNPAVRIDATEAMGVSRSGTAVEFCARIFILLDGKAALVVDRAQLRHAGRMESRMHTETDVRFFKTGAALKGKRRRMRIACAADVPAKMWEAAGAVTTPCEAPTMLRWCTDGLHTDMTLAALLVPGGGAASLSVERDGTDIVLDAASKPVTTTVRLTEALEPKRS